VYLTPYAIPYHSFTGDSSAPRKQPRSRPDERKGKKAAIKRRKGKQVRVDVKRMDSVEYALMRQGNWYDQSQDVELDNNHFWNAEQISIYEDIYASMKMRPMRPLDLNFMKKKNEFAAALTVTQKLGLHHLMQIQCDYHEYYVKQFFSTLVFKKDEDISMVWMTDDTAYEANFHDFAAILGYSFDGLSSPVGHRVHGPNHPNKDVLQDLYEPGYPVGKVAGLLPLYAQLVLLFRDNITPSGGNNDAVRTSLVNLLHYASRAAADRRTGQRFNLDVMNFIFNEMHEALVSRLSIPYAPYIMMLLKDKVGTEFFDSSECVAHKIKAPYVKKRAAPSLPTRDTFMADARASAMPRGPAIGKEIKKLNWFQRNVLCMNVDIRKSQYKAHLENQQILHNQALIIHRLKRSELPPPKQKTPLPYKTWTGSSVDWVEMEKQLGIHTSGSTAQQAQDDDDDSEAEYESEADEDDVEGDDDDDEEGEEDSDE
jgi:hypothetical protein